MRAIFALETVCLAGKVISEMDTYPGFCFISSLHNPGSKDAGRDNPSKRMELWMLDRLADATCLWRCWRFIRLSTRVLLECDPCQKVSVSTYQAKDALPSIK